MVHFALKFFVPRIALNFRFDTFESIPYSSCPQMIQKCWWWSCKKCTRAMNWSPGVFSSLLFDQVVLYYSQRHVADRNAIYIVWHLVSQSLDVAIFVVLQPNFNTLETHSAVPRQLLLKLKMGKNRFVQFPLKSGNYYFPLSESLRIGLRGRP